LKSKITALFLDFSFSLCLFSPLWCPSLFSPYFFSPVLGGVGGLICRLCNLSIPFHGCLLDFGTCRTKAGQYCITEVHFKGGIQWYSVKGCTENLDKCFKEIVTAREIYYAYCCHQPLCNF
uniref:Uncharacterized protein C9orf57 homolog n=1 Tax=Camelus bactrianus TaxID=9837 RepID=A0A9W3EML9_CAMBA